MARTAEQVWSQAAIFFILLFIAGSLFIIIYALSSNGNDLPENIDVVLLDQRRDRERGQANAVLKYMPWVNNIWVLSPEHDGVKNGLTYISFNGTQAEAFQKIPDIPGIADHAIFLSDQTIPCAEVHKTYLFKGSRPRVFNVLENPAVTALFADQRETIEPTIVAAVDTIDISTDTNDYVRRASITEVVSVNNSMKRDIYFYDVNLTEVQLKNLEDDPPLFATLHVTGSDADTLNQSWLTFINAIQP
jgi:hypothetical protein